MNPPRATVHGIPENQARLEGVRADVHRMADTHRAIAELVRGAAAANVPNTTGRGTGRLAGSLTAAADDQAGWLEHGTEYGGIIEAGYQYTQRAIDGLHDNLVATYDAGLSAIVERHA